mgnify:CR=1 FL=1
MIWLKIKIDNMPYGKGTYGSKVGRPKKKKVAKKKMTKKKKK